MILNLQLFTTSELSDHELVTLLIIKNKGYEMLEQREVSSLNDRGLITWVKGKPKTPPHLNIRLSKTGTKFLNNLGTPHVTEEVKAFALRLINIYESYQFPDDRVGSHTKIASRLAWFLLETGAEEEVIEGAVKSYLAKEEARFVTKLENLIWKAPNVYAVKPTLMDSKLYYLIKNLLK